ncbi:HutD/Ves family protein [Sphingomonas fennica]|uniref:HutD-family protein n=1 Tax=Edaphosphingomonas fennica TaxID=114404 RepID=A0A2T4HUD1_9SPHN|nr:HutD family protein [Sphingomonas fennica]PTD19370.1 hypothetical protein CV103_13540 [Sphingomonas fennica]
MTADRLLRARDRVAVPWKNGGGVTREIRAHPPGAGMGDFQWRFSMAEVAAAGPFSIFPGVDRILAVLAGELRLAGEAIGERTITPESPPFAFAGDVAMDGTPIGGAVIDLNAMVRRDRYRAEMTRLGAGLHAVAAPFAILIALGPIEATAGGRAFRLDRHDGLDLDGEAEVRIENAGAGALLVRFRPL